MEYEVEFARDGDNAGLDKFNLCSLPCRVESERTEEPEKGKSLWNTYGWS